MKIFCFLLCCGMFVLSGKVFGQSCTGSLGDPVVTIDFGRGTASYGPPLGSDKTNYNYVASYGPTDGSYTIIKSLGNGGWFNTKNHTPNDPDGYFMMINASNEPGIFYQTETQMELCANTTYEFAAWVTNLLTYTGIKPNLTFSVLSMDGEVLGTLQTGPIPESAESTWKQYALSFTTTTAGKVRIQLRNNAPGGNGNDLGLDDITFRACGPTMTSGVDGVNTTDKVICEGGSVTLSTTVSGSQTLQYLWQEKAGSDWTDLSAQNTTSLTLSNLPVGNHQYRLMAAETANFSSPICRTASAVYNIQVKALPVLTVLTTREVCLGSTIKLDVSGTEGTYQWTGPNDYRSTEKSPVIENAALNNTGDYQVTVTANGCVASAVIHVEVFEPPLARVAEQTVSICEGTSVPLGASGGRNYRWLPATRLSATDVASPMASPVQNTRYTVTVSNGPCEDTASVLVRVIKKIRVSAGENRATVAGQSFTLEGSVTGDQFSFFWTPSDYLDDARKINPVASPLKDIKYTLIAVSKENCKGDSSSVWIKVYPKLEIPNSFSPNGDGVNDLWRIEALEGYPKATLMIVNRYGQRVFRSSPNLKQWDGRYNGKDVPVGVYYYLLKLQEPDKTLSGSIMLLR